tara:strand:- start:1549 stop:1797 length:249 start_codon:yes stop_codon:yes gene_type:complete
VDGTLIQDGRLNRRLAEWAKEKKAEGFEVILWTAQGVDHARRVADAHGIAENFTAIIGKPGFIVDDMGWRWVKYTKILRRLF